MIKVLAIGMAAFVLSAPVSAQTAAPLPTSTPGAKPNRYERIVCKTMQVTGSLIAKKKTCKSQADWDKEAEATQHNYAVDSCRDRANGGALCS